MQISCIRWTSKTLKRLQLQGGFATLAPHRGLCPLDPRWGLCPQTSVIGSRYRARHGPHTFWHLRVPMPESKGCQKQTAPRYLPSIRSGGPLPCKHSPFDPLWPLTLIYPSNFKTTDQISMQCFAVIILDNNSRSRINVVLFDLHLWSWEVKLTALSLCSLGQNLCNLL